MVGIMVLALAAAAQPRGYRPPDGRSYLLGPGQWSCAAALKGENAFASASWTLGFWSGLNYSRSSALGYSTDREGILAEVKKECEAQPSQLLIQAVSNVYVAMSKRTGE